MHVSIIRRWIHKEVNNPVGAIREVVWWESGRTAETGSATTQSPGLKSRTRDRGSRTQDHSNRINSQCRGRLLQSHYFKDATSSSAAEGLFQCPGCLEFYRGRRISLRDISRLHMCRLRGLRIPTMLCARTNFQIFGGSRVPFKAGHMTHTCTPVSLFHNSSLSEARKDSCLASEEPDSEDMCYQGSVFDLEKHPLSHWCRLAASLNLRSGYSTQTRWCIFIRCMKKKRAWSFSVIGPSFPSPIRRFRTITQDIVLHAIMTQWACWVSIFCVCKCVNYAVTDLFLWSWGLLILGHGWYLFAFVFGSSSSILLWKPILCLQCQLIHIYFRTSQTSEEWCMLAEVRWLKQKWGI